MNGEIKEAIPKCSVCAESRANNPKEPMQTPKVPDRPWRRLAVDMLPFRKKYYIVLEDYCSDFVEVQELSDTTSPAIIQFLKEQFSWHRIPDILISENVPQLTSHQFRKLTTEWEFKHVTSSPHHHKSNGKAGSAVKVTKSLFKKAFRDEKDPWLALLEYRNTPVETTGSSPAQRLMSQRTKTLIPTAPTLLQLRVVEGVEDKIILKRQKVKSYHDQTAKPLLPLEVGQEARVAPLQRGMSWQAGTLVKQLSDRSYLVKTGSETIRRNRQFLKPQEQSAAKVGMETSHKVTKPVRVPVPEVSITKKVSPHVPDPAPDPVTNHLPDPVPDLVSDSVPMKCTRTRIIKPPLKFKDFI